MVLFGMEFKKLMVEGREKVNCTRELAIYEQQFLGGFEHASE
jgi:hypothetical protein